jgi:hypothetical protein
MTENENVTKGFKNESKSAEIIYNPEKDFYKGVGGELRLKAEGLFKKAKERGISIEEVKVNPLRENNMDFPGIGIVELPAYIVVVKGKDIQSNQVIVDGKYLDYYNRYQKYLADRIESKNLVKDEKGKIVRENGKPRIKQETELSLTDWERFEIGKNIIEDKEFGLEKTITGACNRVIRKLMGENDWLYPEEARLLDEEFNMVQNAIGKEREIKSQAFRGNYKKATERQINYFKARIRNHGLEGEDQQVIREILRQSGYEMVSIDELSTSDMSKIIDNINEIMPKVKDALSKQEYADEKGEIH